MGSCFAVNMAEKFDHFQFRNEVNPLGILFHPQALERFMQSASEKKSFTETDIFYHNERWHCFDAHSDVSHSDKETLLTNLNNAIVLTHDYLKTASHFIITLGTAWVYRKSDSGNLVANCHKVPQREFSKEVLGVDDISRSICHIVELISQHNPNAQTIFTVSPVRHIKDGFAENQRSKSHLLAGLHSALENTGNCHYFPSYEIVMDELRDYRFYAPDMIHPNQVAIDYIWEKFVSCWISENVSADMNEVDAIRKALAHKPFNPDSEQHRKFVSAVENRIRKLRERLPFLGFS
ncbi:GSCFA domain-containing protein [Flavobacterium agri]|uniref:GSCFA domain-containing protein n=1 Tax=Flavobacterium agri TaxID=2743471 RepID=UPI00293BF3B4|nr:GSCFA domain-containing protein [Flavobacterium agri]